MTIITSTGRNLQSTLCPQTNVEATRSNDLTVQYRINEAVRQLNRFNDFNEAGTDPKGYLKASAWRGSTGRLGANCTLQPTRMTFKPWCFAASACRLSAVTNGICIEAAASNAINEAMCRAFRVAIREVALNDLFGVIQ